MLTPGTRLGPYEIVSPLGAGGMGEVYKARDTRLDRTVAIKVLPAQLADDPQFRERFDREAKAISALDHPHICTLYDVGVHDGTAFLVMQYLEGESLDVRLQKGALPLEQALTYAIQIAGALDKAHRAGIVHRDLKPGNVVLTKAGAILLDFGLAKMAAPAGATAGLSMLPTTPANLTAQGTILGTFQYMAPEQLEGQDAGTRTDMFAFGAVVYEMVTGKRPFEGKSQAALIGAIMHSDPPPLTRHEPLTPPMLDRVVRKCLEKDPDNRWQTARDLVTQLTWIAEGGARTAASESGPAQAPARAPILRAWAAAATALLVIATAMLAYLYLRPSAPAEEVRFLVSVPPMPSSHQLSISPDGRSVAFAAAAAGKRVLFVRAMSSTTAQPVAELDSTDTTLFWSPDSRYIAFASSRGLKKVDASGGPPQNLCDLTFSPLFGTWSREGVIIVGSTQGLYRMSASGCEPSLLVPLDSSKGEVAHQAPYFLPDGRHYLYLAWAGDVSNRAIYAGSLDSPTRTRVLASSSMPIYVEPGYLLFHREGTLFAQPFNARTLALSGEPVRLADEIAYSAADTRAAFSASQTGVLIYRTGFGKGEDLQLTWVDRRGKVTGTLGAPGTYIGVALSPDGKRAAVHRHDPSGGDIWIVDVDRGTTSRLTFDPTQDNSSPVWSPDGARIVFASQRNGKSGLYSKRADGTGSEETLEESAVPKTPLAWSRDGRFVVYSVNSLGGGDLWVLPLTGERKPAPFLQTPFAEGHARVSPNGRWLAYDSNESGASEVYVRSFPSGAGKWQVSTAGGARPAWSADGGELFFLSAERSAGKMMAADIRESGSSVQPGIPHELFPQGFLNIGHPQPYHPYAVAPDGRFLIPRSTSVAADTTSIPITVVMNWTAALKK